MGAIKRKRERGPGHLCGSRPSGPNSSQGPSRQEWQKPSGKCLTRPRMRPTAHRLNAPRVLASMASLAGRQEARTSAKVPRANQTRCVGQPRIRARALTLGNLGGQVHKEPGRHRRLSTGYSGPRGCCVPAWIGRVARQGRGVETSVCLIRFQFTGAPQTENGLQSHGRREEVRDLSGAGVNAYLGRVTDRGLPLPAVVDTPQRSHKAGCAGVGAGLRTGLSC